MLSRTPLTGLATVAALVLGLATTTCGGGPTRSHPLDRSWNDADGAELRAFQQAWAPSRAAMPPGLCVAVVDDHTLVGRDLDRGHTWRFEHPLAARPTIAGSIVVGVGDGELFGLSGSTGELLWTRPSVGRLRGADDDGTTTVVSLGSLSNERSIVLAIARDGRVVRQLDVPERVGSPAVYGEHAFLPWNDHWVVIFDLVGGREAARVVSKHRLRHAAALDGALLFGETELLAFDGRVVEARRGRGTVVRLPRRDGLGNTPWLGVEPAELPLSATRQDAARQYARPTLTRSPDGTRRTRIWGDRYLVTSFRLALGLDAVTGQTQWVHVGETAFLGGAAGRSAFVLCDGHGNVRWLDSHAGVVLRQDTLGAPVLSCTVGHGAELRPRPPRVPRPTTPDRPLAEQLAAALALDDPRSLAAQLDLLADLAEMSGDRPTEILIDVASSETNAAALRREARQLLRRRRTGRRAMLRALEQAATPWPLPARAVPMEALAQALTAMQVPAAAPLLAARLHRPDVEPREILHLLRALRHLAGDSERWALRRFAVQHRCEADQPWLGQAVLLALETLVEQGDRGVAERILAAPCTGPWLQRRLHALLE